jgi:hypothetical protein
MIRPTEAPQRHRILIDICLANLVPFLWQGPGLLLIDRAGLGSVLAELDRRNIRVLGLDGFELDGAVVHPRLDLIYDADRVPGFPSPEEVIETWPDDVWVDVTISAPS